MCESSVALYGPKTKRERANLPDLVVIPDLVVTPDVVPVVIPYLVVTTDLGVTPDLVVDSEVPTNRKEIALLEYLVLVHAVAKWLHQVSWKYVMLWHPGSISHVLLHIAMVGTFFEDLAMYTSPASASHMRLDPISCHVRPTTMAFMEIRREGIRAEFGVGLMVGWA